MPKKTVFRRKVRKDKKQDTRIASLENFVYKTIENKQQNFHSSNIAIKDVPYYAAPDIRLTQGAGDGAGRPDAARIGNSITLMTQRYNFELRVPKSAPQGQTARLIVVESVDGAENLEFEDILEYWQTQAGTATGADRETYTSHYTTKSAINKRYKIHMDKTVHFNEGVRNVVMPRLKIKYGSKKNPGKVVDYVGGGVNDNPVNHKVTIMCVSDNLTTAEQPRLTYSLRSIYKDA